MTVEKTHLQFFQYWISIILLLNEPMNQHYQGRKICFVILCEEQNGTAVYNGISGLCSVPRTTVVLLGSGYPSDWNKAKSDKGIGRKLYYDWRLREFQRQRSLTFIALNSVLGDISWTNVFSCQDRFCTFIFKLIKHVFVTLMTLHCHNTTNSLNPSGSKFPWYNLSFLQCLQICKIC